MGKITGGLVGSTGLDNLIAKLYPPVDSFLVELKTPGGYKRGTVLSREADGSYEVLGKGSGKASAVIADDTQDGDGTAVAYRSGHFNRQALLFGEGYELTAEDENELRLAGIHLSDAVGCGDPAGEEEEPAGDEGKTAKSQTAAKQSVKKGEEQA